jgi:MoaA/NifB/PqqE/SkfB family radical SAM enzyme
MNNNIQKLFENKSLSQEQIASILQHRQIDLELTGKCSLMCPYCISANSKTYDSSLINGLGIEAFLKKLEHIAKPYMPLLFAIIGPGEPTESEYFVPIVKRLLELGNNIKIMTNIRGIVNIQKAISKENGHRVQLVVSFHLGAFLERQNRDYLRGEFMANIKVISELGCKINTINTPLSPAILHENVALYLSDIKEIMNITQQQFQPTPVEMYGFYHGKRYPESYTKEELTQIAFIHEQLHYNYQQHGLVKKEDTNVIANQQLEQQIQHLENQLTLKQCPCVMMMKHIAIDLFGRVRYCNMVPPFILGNFRDFPEHMPIFSNNPVQCPADICHCKSSGTAHALFPYGITLNQYYEAYYSDQNKPEIAKLFNDEKNEHNRK